MINDNKDLKAPVTIPVLTNFNTNSITQSIPIPSSDKILSDVLYDNIDPNDYIMKEPTGIQKQTIDNENYILGLPDGIIDLQKVEILRERERDAYFRQQELYFMRLGPSPESLGLKDYTIPQQSNEIINVSISNEPILLNSNNVENKFLSDIGKGLDVVWNKVVVPVAKDIAAIGVGIGQGVVNAAREIWNGQPLEQAYQAGSFYNPYLVGGGERIPDGTLPNQKGNAITTAISEMWTKGADKPGPWYALFNATANATFYHQTLVNLNDGFFGYSKTVDLWEQLEEEFTSLDLSGNVSNFLASQGRDYEQVNNESYTVPNQYRTQNKNNDLHSQVFYNHFDSLTLYLQLRKNGNIPANLLRKAYNESLITENKENYWGLNAYRNAIAITNLDNNEELSVEESYLQQNHTNSEVGIHNQFLPVISDYRDDLTILEEIPHKDTTKTSEDVLLEKLENKRSSAIEYLINSGPDFMKNMFDVALLCYSNEEKSYVDFFDRVFKSDFFENKFSDKPINSSMFMIRTASIEVPQIESETFDLKFGFESVKKIKSKVKYERKANLKITIDEPLYFLGLFNMLSNNNKIIFDEINTENRYPKGFTTFTTNKVITESLKNKQIRIDLIIKHQQFNNNYQSTIDEWRKSTKDLVHGFADLRSKELPLWYFEDINFLGQSDPLSFNQDNSDVTDITFPFLFKRCIKIDRQFRHGTQQETQYDNRSAQFLHGLQEENIGQFFSH